MQAFFRPADPDLPHLLEVRAGERECVYVIRQEKREREETQRERQEPARSRSHRDSIPPFPPLFTHKQEAHDRFPPSTKIVCTLGPVTNDVDTLCQLLEAGMTVRKKATFRLRNALGPLFLLPQSALGTLIGRLTPSASS